MFHNLSDNKVMINTSKILCYILVTILFLYSSLTAQTYNINQPGKITTCTGNFFDDGGSSSNYSLGKIFTKTFCSGDTTKCIQVAFSTMDLYQFGGSPDASLYVYDGADTNATMITVLTGNNITTVVGSTRSGGCLTFKFVSKNSPFVSQAAAGWAGTISCIACGPPPPPSVQDCPGAIPICKSIYSESNSYQSPGNILEIPANSTGCIGSSGGETNSIWYKFTVRNAGSLNFLIKPNNNSDDYDWELFNLTNKQCPDIIKNYTSVSVSCNSSCCDVNGTPVPITGMSNNNGGSTNTNGPGNANTYNKELNVKVGETYYLCLINASFSKNGYTIDFSGSSASIFDNINPVFQTVNAVSCGDKSISLLFSEKIYFKSIQNGDFALKGPGGPYTINNWTSPVLNTGTGNGDSTIILNFTPALSAVGSYSLCLVNTSGSVTDFCDNLTSPVCFTFSPCSPPTPSVIVNSATICANSCSTLNTTVTNGTGPFTYTWTPALGLSSTSTSTVSACPLSTTVYTITIKDAANNTASTTAVVTVINNPTITINSPIICAGVTTTLIASGATTYTWSGGVTPTTGSVVSTSPNANTTYTVAGSVGTCTNIATTTVTVVPNPTITVTSSTICANGTATLSATGATTYTWSSGLSSTTGSVVTGSPGSTTVYTVTGSDGSCNSLPVTSTITIGTSLSVFVPSVDICAGATATLTGSGATSYTWLPNNVTGATFTDSPSTNTTYTVIGLDGACTGSTTTQIIVNAIPSVSVTNAIVCSGTPTVLTASGATTYTWSSNATTNTISVSPTANPTTYTVTGSVNGCTNMAVSIVSVMATPTMTVKKDTLVVKGTSTPLSVVGSGTSYTWAPSLGLSCATCTNPIASPMVTTEYCVSTMLGSCPTTSCITVSVEVICYSNADYTTPSAFTPNGDDANDEFCLQGWADCTTSFYIAIFDRWGEKVFDSKDPGFCWDGTYLGMPLNTAVFVYYIKADILKVGTITKKGNITLIK